MYVEDHMELAEFKRLARAEKDARLAKRIQMVVLAIGGYTAPATADLRPAIAMSLGISRRTCQHWVRQFNERGWEGLLDKPSRGRSPLLTPEEQERLKDRVAAGALPVVGSGCGRWNTCTSPNRITATRALRFCLDNCVALNEEAA